MHYSAFDISPERLLIFILKSNSRNVSHFNFYELKNYTHTQKHITHKPYGVNATNTTHTYLYGMQLNGTLFNIWKLIA